ncbi:MAG: tRNA pseudouridine(55) synthase TruB [Desulfobacterales bacterium]|jgi:tRNA pseudouridine55 synthase
MRSSSSIQKQPIKNRQRLNGIIVIDKPKNITSARVVADVKRMLDARKVGHAGTLDPFAEGVLVCCINDATRLARFLLAGNKTYDATLKLGIETDTQDKTGTVTAVKPVLDWPEDKINSAAKKFEGRIEQQPPVFSALKHKGTPLYRLARKGTPVQKPARRVHISKIRILEVSLPLVRFEVSCSAGTYIRSLCADIGRQLGCGGHLQALKRTESSGFKIQQAISPEQLERRIGAGDTKRYLISMTDALKEMPTCIADQKLIEKIRHGKHLKKSDIRIDRSSGNSKKQNANIKIVDCDNILHAVLNYEKNSDRLTYACVFPN